MSTPRLLILLVLFALAASPVRAEQKIATVDLRKVFDDYYKTKAADKILKEQSAKLEKEQKAHIDSLQRATDNYKKALEDANNQAISADERDKRRKEAEGKLLEVRELEQTLSQFDRSARAKLEEDSLQARNKILAEIRVAVTNMAKTGGFALVVDTAAESANRAPIFLFTDGQNDLTSDILRQLNASAPPDLLNSDSSGSKLLDSKPDKK